MSVQVIKFGGSSLRTPEDRQTVYEKIVQHKKETQHLVVVVSAPGRQGDPYATDTLLGLVNKEGAMASLRELDMIYACGEVISATMITTLLIDRGYPAISLNGWQAGLITDDLHFDASVKHIQTDRIKKHLEAGKIVVVAGSQGVSDSGDITTLGRGGSDTTAVALAGALSAGKVVIYTDVPGMMTADPKLIPSAKLIPLADYDFTRCYAENGAKVIHAKAIGIAHQFGCKNIHIKPTFSTEEGTNLSIQRQDAIGLAYREENDQGVIVFRHRRKGVKEKLSEIIQRHEGWQIRHNQIVLEFKLPGSQWKSRLEHIHQELINQL